MKEGSSSRYRRRGAAWLREARLPTSGWLLAMALLTVGCVAGEVGTGPERPRSLPSTAAVKEGLRQRLTEGETQKALFRERYRHVRVVTREERNTKGKLRKRSEERVVHDPSATEPADGEKDPPPGQGRAYQERDLSFGGEVLDRFEFRVEGREEIEGQTVLRVAFQPLSGDLPKHGLMDRFINRTGGILWLEEPSLELVRARMALQEPVELWGGIAGVVHQLEMAYDRACTPEGLWYTRRGFWQADYRKFLVRSLVEFEERYTEVELAK